MTPIYKLISGHHYDQEDPNTAILKQAVQALAQGYTRAWFVLPEYNTRVFDPALVTLEETLDHRASYAFRVEVPQGVRTARKTLPTEFHEQHGGVYLFDLEDYVDRLHSRPLGEGCHTHEALLGSRRPYAPAMVTYTNDEWNSPTLRAVRRDRDGILDAAGIEFGSRVLWAKSSIREQHETLFGEMCSDLLVLDADFLPFNAALLLEELRLLPDANNNIYVHLWHCANPVNGLVYGHGAPKLFPRKAQLLSRTSHLEGDFTLSVGAGLVEHEVCLGKHIFNWSEFSTWRAAAKETAKLKLVAETDARSKARHDIWCDAHNVDPTADHADYCIAGARYGSANARTVLSSSSEDLKAVFDNLRGANG